MSGIGLLNEKPLHASLKQWYARPGDRFEVAMDGFVIDAGLESFTARDLATATGTRGELAQKMAYCLQKGSVTELIGKRGRAHLYRVATADRSAHPSGCPGC